MVLMVQHSRRCNAVCMLLQESCRAETVSTPKLMTHAKLLLGEPTGS